MSDKNSDPLEDVEYAGISEDEKTEIRGHIEKVATENKIDVSGDAFSLKSFRAGALFPLLVNIGAIVSVAVVVLVLAALFRQDERVVTGRTGEIASVEGRLIQELRRESQAQLFEKERQIATVQKRLDEIERERLALAASIDERIQQREQELRAELERELEEERARLLREGLGDDEIENLMRVFEAERTAYYEQQIAQYRAELEAERLAVEQNLDQLRAEYNGQLEALREERLRLAEEFREREVTLRAQLEQRTRILDRARTEAIENLASAQEELAQLSRRQELAGSIQNQIIGQIGQIRSAVSSEQYGLARSRIESLRSFLNEDRVLAIPEIARRREMDLFLLDSLEAVIELEMAADGEVLSLSDELGILARIRSTTAEARSATDAELATERYRTALSQLPELSEAYAFVWDRDAEMITAVRDAEIAEQRESARQAVIAALDAATTLIDEGRYGAAFTAYRDVLATLPATSDVADPIVGGAARTGFSLSRYVVTGEPVDGMGVIADTADVSLGDERARFEAMLADTAATAAAEQRSRLEAERAELVRERDELTRELDETRGALAEDRSEAIGAVADELEETYRSQLSEREAQISEQESRIAELSSRSDELEQRIVALDAEVARLAEFERITEAAVESYTRYVTEEDRAFASGRDAEALFEARFQLDTFLVSDAVRRLFPELGDRIRVYDQAFEDAGREVAFLDVLEIISIAAEFPTPEQRVSFLQSETGAVNDAVFRELLEELTVLVQQ